MIEFAFGIAAAMVLGALAIMFVCLAAICVVGTIKLLKAKEW